MLTRLILRCAQLCFWFVFVLLQLGCAAPEIIPTASHLPSSAQVQAEKEALAIPADLRARLKAVAAQSCKVAENDRPNPRYIAQQVSAEGSRQLALLVAVAEWLIEKKTGSTQPVVVTTPDVEDKPLSKQERVDLVVGVVAGGMEGAVPFGPVMADVAIEVRILPKGTYYARVGKACGEIAVGVGQMALGCAGMGAGLGVSGTGVGAVPGVVVVSGFAAVAANGACTAAHGVGDLGQLLRDGPPPEDPPAPTAEAPVAAAPPPKPKAVTPAETSTVTRYKDSSGKTTKTVKESASGSRTETRPRAPAQTETPVKPKASEAQATAPVKPKSGTAKKREPNHGVAKPHGGKEHNDAIDREIAQLHEEGIAKDIRKNQQQVDANGDRVGTNRPDLQYDKDGCHTCVEYDHSPSRSAEHARTIRRNDPNAKVELKKP